MQPRVLVKVSDSCIHCTSEHGIWASKSSHKEVASGPEVGSKKTLRAGQPNSRKGATKWASEWGEVKATTQPLGGVEVLPPAWREAHGAESRAKPVDEVPS